MRCLYVPRDHIINNPLIVIPGFSPLPRHFLIYFDVIIPKISKKVKKVSHKGGINTKISWYVRCLYVPRDHIINNPLRGIPGFSPLPRHLPIYFDVIIPKISKKSKKSAKRVA